MENVGDVDGSPAGHFQILYYPRYSVIDLPNLTTVQNAPFS